MTESDIPHADGLQSLRDPFSNVDEQDELRSFSQDEYAARRELARKQEWLDELALRRLQLLQWLFHAAKPTVVIVAVLIPLLLTIAIVTVGIHLFIPSWGWLTDAQQSRLVSWYSSLSQIAFPVLLLTNPWVIEAVRRRFSA